MEHGTDYSFEVQKIYLEMMLGDATTFGRCQSIFDGSLFDKKLRPAAEFMHDYVAEFNALPTFEMVNAKTKVALEPHPNVDDTHYEWLLDEFERFTRHKSLERAILSSPDLLEKGDYGAVEDSIKKAVQIALTKDLGTDYFDDPKLRLTQMKDINGQVPTNWTALDEKLYGGMNRGELNIIAGASGTGKSLFLANLAVNWTAMGLNVVYVSLELSESLVSLRLDGMQTGLSTREIFRSIENVDLKVKLLSKTQGKLQIKYLPSGKTVNDIRAYLKEYEIQRKLKVDVVLVDYLDLLMPISRKISPSDLFIKDKYVSEELRNLAVEKNCILVTASQLNRGSIEEVDYDHSHIAGGISKIHTADNVFGIYTSRAMREQGRYQLQFLKTRNSAGVGQKIDLDFNIESLRITDSDRSDSTANMPSSAILSALKNRSAKPVEDEHVPKVKIEGSRLRELLNRLPSDDDLDLD